MNVQEFCKKYNLTEDQFYGRDWVEGYLDLHSVKRVPDGFSVKVRGSLYYGDMDKSLAISAKRFGISEQLLKILKNTVEYYLK